MIYVPPPDSPPTLPLWMQIFAFLISAALAFLKIIEYFRKPKLNLHLTRDMFFRLIENGEALFCSAVLLASNGPILVKNIEASLKRVNVQKKPNYAEKSFPLRVAQHGEKVHGTSVNVQHKFFGSSPLQYLEAYKPYRAVYLCFQREYQAKQKEAVDDFVIAVEAFRANNNSVTDEDAPLVRSSFTDLIEKHYNLLASLIQLEAGDYRLEVNLNYQCVGWFFFGAGQNTISTINFSIEQKLLDRWRSELRTTLVTRGQQILLNEPKELIYPEIEPVDVIESQPA